jgi:hypothetical protein
MKSSEVRLVCIDSNKKVLYAVKKGKCWNLETPSSKEKEFRSTTMMESEYFDEILEKKI